MRTTSLVVLGVAWMAGGATPARADEPGVGPEVVVEPPVPGAAPAAGDQWAPVLAGSPDGFLAVWRDGRDAAAGGPARATRLDAGGRPLDGEGLEVPGSRVAMAALPGTVDAAWGGGVWLVVFEAPGEGGAGEAVRAARLGPDGVWLDPEGIDVAAGVRPVVAWDGTEFLVAWIAGAPSTYEAAWGRIRIARMGADGTVIDPGGRLVDDGPASEPAIAAHAGQALVAWTAQASMAGPTEARGAIVSSGGGDPGWIPVALAGGAASQGAVRVAWDGAAYRAVWSAYGGGATTVVTATVTPAGAVGAATVLGVGSAPVVGKDPDGVFAAWPRDGGASLARLPAAAGGGAWPAPPGQVVLTIGHVDQLAAAPAGGPAPLVA